MPTIFDARPLAEIARDCHTAGLNVDRVLFAAFLVNSGRVTDEMNGESADPWLLPCSQCGREARRLPGTTHCDDCSVEGIVRRLARCWTAAVNP